MDARSYEGPASPYLLLSCVVAFCVAMGLRGELNLWIGTGVAASMSLGLLWSFSPTTFRSNLRLLSFRFLMAGVIVGLAMSVATWLLYPLAVSIVPAVGVEVRSLYALLREPPGPLKALPVLILVVAAEEFVWRALAIDLFTGVLGARRAVVISALAYTLPQFALQSPLLVLVALLCGLAWGALRVATGGLAAPFAAHLVWDLLVFVAFPVA